MLPRVFNKIYGSAIVLKKLHGQRSIAYTISRKVHQLRDVRLRKIIRYAAESVPYYQELFRASRIDYRDIRTTRDLDNLPLITKEMVRDDPEMFISRALTGEKSIQFVTSGTTGTPLKIHHDINSILSNIAYCESEKEVVRQYLGEKKNIKKVTIIYSGSTLRKIWNVYSQYTFLKPPSENNLLFVEGTFDELIKKINILKPDIINGYGSHLEALFKYAIAYKIKIHQPKVLSYGADGMTESGKDIIKNGYNLVTFSRYGAVECFRIGYTCEHDTGFHIHESLCDLKIVGPDGTRLADGEQGEVVISNLVNKGTVLLNYNLGDIAIKSSNSCSCGRSHPLLTDLVGRIEDFISLPNGEVVHPRVIWNAFKGFSGIDRYQLIQHTYKIFELKLATKEYSVYLQILPYILKNLRAVLGDARISSNYFEQIDSSPNGKFRAVISHCKKQ